MMSKKKILIPLIVFSTLLSTTSVYTYQMLFSPNFLINQPDKMIIIEDNTDFKTLTNQLIEDTLLNDIISFSFLSKLMKYSENVKEGNYKVKMNMSNYDLISMLRSGNQTPINITFSYSRKINDLAQNISQKLKISEKELMDYIIKNGLANYGFDTQNIIGMFLPDTYEVYWDITPKKLLDKMKKEYDKFWNSERIRKLKRVNLSKNEVITLASIVASETNKIDEADRIAGVYINRLRKKMLLQADPTLIFAANDFSIRRVLNKHKKIKSPYNTYMNKGLPPGPIRLSPKKYIDAVLNFEDHRYIYFCAKDDFSGYHEFAITLSEHNKNARKFQRALNKRKIYK
ncbi:MAG: aminodeoxychorismate lyase [Cytophagia bacterium]|nr:aminodeoxychorismate lyase [Cytophagia bacterium]